MLHDLPTSILLLKGNTPFLAQVNITGLTMTNQSCRIVFKIPCNSKGTELHDFAAKCITLGQKLPKSQKTLNMYVNDAIGFKMVPEQPLFYSENCFGTTDAIAFRNRMLRIHDLKTGVIPAHMEQLEIYAALFCLEYKIKPADIEMELRFIRTTRFFMRIQRLKPLFPSWTRSSHSTK